MTNYEKLQECIHDKNAVIAIIYDFCLAHSLNEISPEVWIDQENRASQPEELLTLTFNMLEDLFKEIKDDTKRS